MGSLGAGGGVGGARRPRFLCLHGFRTSGEIMRKQVVGKWPAHVTARLDLVFPDAPFPAEGKSDVEGIFDAPYYEWFQFDKGFTEYRNLDECFDYIEELMIKQGPFDGLMGFSQGSILSAALVGLQEQEPEVAERESAGGGPRARTAPDLQQTPQILHLLAATLQGRRLEVLKPTSSNTATTAARSVASDPARSRGTRARQLPGAASTRRAAAPRRCSEELRRRRGRTPPPKPPPTAPPPPERRRHRAKLTLHYVHTEIRRSPTLPLPEQPAEGRKRPDPRRRGGLTRRVSENRLALSGRRGGDGHDPSRACQEQGLALTRVPKIKFLVIIGGARFRSPTVSAKAYANKIKIPALHFLGDNDFLRSGGEELIESFVDPFIIRHPKGHTVPRLVDEKSLEVMSIFLDKMEKELSEHSSTKTEASADVDEKEMCI